MTKKILLLYTSVGLGHKYIALNMAYHLERSGHTARLHDVLQLQEGTLSNIGVWLHSLVNRKFPWIWRWLYLSNWFTTITLPLRIILASRNSDQVLKIITEYNPDVIISTQTTASAIVASLKRKQLFHGKFVIAFSDYHLHRYWLYDEADLYLANISEQRDVMQLLGISPSKVVVCGITLRPLQTFNRQEIKTKLGIKTESQVVLVSAGSLGIGLPENFLEDFAKQLQAVSPSSTVIVICGKNKTLQTSLNELKLHNLKVLGFHEPMSELYAITDLLLTKPGGLTIAEALQCELQIQITHWLPGQEELNYNFLVSKNLINPIPADTSTKNFVENAVYFLTRSKGLFITDSNEITQKNHEGELLLKAIKSLFHDV